MLTRAALLDHIAAAAQTPGTRSALLVLRVLQQPDFRIDFGYDVAERAGPALERLLASVLRPGDRIARLGEHSFALFLPRLASQNHALLAANRLVRALRDELRVDGNILSSEVALGLCEIEDESAHELLRRADLASAQAQRSGQTLVRWASDRVHGTIPLQDLREAVGGGELAVWLQPLWDLRQARVVGAESLARWASPRHGWVSPDVFVPMAEQGGLIGDFTRWSLNASLRLCAEARLRQPDLQVAVNISPRIFAEDDIVEQVLAALRLWGVPPQAVVLEVTEGAVMEDPHRSGRMLQRLHEAGLGVAIDDFGTGYSSFAYLRQFPATELKIDQSFVRALRSEARSLQLVRSMIDLAHHLDIAVVAEGVEDGETLRMLAELGCDLVQGFHIRHPQPAEDFIAALQAPRPAIS